MIISKRKYNQLLIDIRNLKILLEESKEYGITCDKCISRLSSDNNKLCFDLFKLRKEYKDKIKIKNKKIKSLKEQIEYLKSEYNEFNFKILDISKELELVEDAEMNEYNFCKFIENIQNILEGGEK